MSADAWRAVVGSSTSWHARWRFWRCEIHVAVHRHRYPTSSDRWVFDPRFVYDRKSAGGVV